MKAISVQQPWASMIAAGKKTIETRLWQTKYRGELLIVSSRGPKIENLPLGKALCVATLIDCRRMTVRDEAAAKCSVYPGAFAWQFTNIRKVKPFTVKGQLGLYNVNDELIEYALRR